MNDFFLFVKPNLPRTMAVVNLSSEKVNWGMSSYRKQNTGIFWQSRVYVSMHLYSDLCRRIIRNCKIHVRMHKSTMWDYLSNRNTLGFLHHFFYTSIHNLLIWYFGSSSLPSIMTGLQTSDCSRQLTFKVLPHCFYEASVTSNLEKLKCINTLTISFACSTITAVKTDNYIW